MDENKLFTVPPSEVKTEEIPQPEIVEPIAEVLTKEAALVDLIESSVERSESAHSTLEKIADFQKIDGGKDKAPESTLPEPDIFTLSSEPRVPLNTAHDIDSTEKEGQDFTPPTPDSQKQATVSSGAQENAQPPSQESDQKTPELAKSMDQDPQFAAAAKQISNDVVEKLRNLPRYQDMNPTLRDAKLLYEPGISKDAEGNLTAFVDQRQVRQEFAKSQPELYTAYVAQEKPVVYQRPQDDPAFRDLQYTLQNLENKYHSQDSGHEYRASTSQEDIGKHRTEKQTAYEQFTTTYPEKAEAYWKSDPDLAEVLAKRESEASRAYTNSEGKLDWQEDPAFHEVSDRNNGWYKMYDNLTTEGKLEFFATRHPEKAQVYAEQFLALQKGLQRREEELNKRENKSIAPESLQPIQETTPADVASSEGLSISSPLPEEYQSSPQQVSPAEQVTTQPIINPASDGPSTFEDPADTNEDSSEYREELKSKEITPPSATEQSTELVLPVDRLGTELKAQGFNAEKVTVPGGGEVLLLKNAESIPPDSVRVYRGYNHFDTSILKQAPYAMRVVDKDSGKVGGIEEIRKHVDSLAHEPTYANLLSYAEAMRPYLSPADTERMEQEIAEVEDGVLAGYSIRTELRMNQVGHLGGTADVGVSPYLSASFNPTESLGYTQGQGSVLVVDLPLSELEAYTGEGEVQIKGSLNPSYITAIIPRESVGNGEDAQVALNSVLSAIPSRPDTLSQNPTKLVEAKQRQQEGDSLFDAIHRPADINAIQQRRFERLKRLFPDTPIELFPHEVNEPYTAAAKKIFSGYKERLTALDGEEPDLTAYEYRDRKGMTKRMDQTKLNPEMLLRLKEIVGYREKRRLERQA